MIVAGGLLSRPLAHVIVFVSFIEDDSSIRSPDVIFGPSKMNTQKLIWEQQIKRYFDINETYFTTIIM